MTNTMPVTFLNKDGLKLFGVLHKPSKNINKDTGIIILSPGIKSRVAPHRLYVKMARRFAQMGFPVLRFDFYGLGDSEGEISEKYVADFYGSVQVGKYINDTISAMDWMERECNIKSFILAGLCGGAITGLLAGARDQRVHSLLGLGIPVILDSVNIDHSRYITTGQLKGLREGYIRNLMSLKRWVRFLTFRSDYRMILKSLLQPFLKKTGVASEPDQTSGEPLQQSNGNFNQYFPMAFHQMLTSRKILLIFSEADRLYWEFEEKYMKPYQSEFRKYSKSLKIDITKNANHIFSFKEWQDDMLEKSCSWLSDHCH